MSVHKITARACAHGSLPNLGLYYLINLGFNFKKDQSFRYGDICKTTRLISIEWQPKKIVVEVVVVIGVGVVVVHVVAVVIPVVDTRNIHNKVWLKPGY